MNHGYVGGQLRTVQATVNGATRTLVHGIRHAPHGAITDWSWGNGGVKERRYDRDGCLTISHDHGWVGHTYHRDALDRVTAIQNWSRGQFNEAYGYNRLDRLTQITSPQGDQSLNYSANGNRTQHNWWYPTGGGWVIGSLVNDAHSNRLINDALAYATSPRFQ